MVSYADIQTGYNRLYAEIRKYIWDFPAVAALADLEIAVYKTFQDISDVKVKYYRLKSFLLEVVHQDEDLASRMNEFEKLLEEDEVYVKINQVEEVIQL